MKKRLFAALLSLCLLLTLLPSAALAAEVGQTVYVGGVGLTTTADNSVVYAKTNTGGTVTAGGSEDDYSIKWDGEILTLKGAALHCVKPDSEIHSGIQREGDLNLVLEGENRISGSSDVAFEDLYGVYASGDLTVSGEGEISIDLNRTAYGTTYGLYGRNVTIESGTLDVAIESNGAGYGAYADNGVYINGGTITMNSASLYGYKLGVTVTPPEGHYITVEYGESSEDTNTYTYTGTASVDYGIYNREYFHSEVIDNTVEVHNPNITIGGVAMYGASDRVAYATTDGNGAVIEITEGFDPATGSWNIRWDGSTLTLNAARIDGSISCGGFTLALIGSNTIAADGLGVFGIDASGGLTIAGDGKLQVNSSYRGISASGLTIQGGDITVKASEYAFLVSNDFILEPPEGGAIFVEAGADAGSAAVIGTYTAREDIRDDVRAVETSPYFRICPAVPVTGVELSENSLALIEGETGTLTATVQPADATYRTVSWQSSNETIAAVQDGTVTAQAPGTATITVATADGSFTDRCTVTVSARSYQISADPSALNFDSVEEGYTEAPAAQTVTVTNTGNQSVTVMLPTSANYTITASTGFAGGAATLNPGGEAQFTVQPNTGLDEGVQDTALTISGSGGASAEVALYFTVTEAAHTHSYNTAAWVSDGISHWHECSCGAKSDVAAHSGGGATCQEQAKCEVCGTAYGALGAHAYGTAWVSDGSSHWHTCTVCEAIADKASHVYDNDRDTTCNVCGYVRQIAPTEFTITFNAAGGTTPASQTTAGGKLTSLPTSTRSGYTLLGWYTAASGGGLVTTDTVFTENTTLYAHWAVRSSGGGGGGGGGSSQSTGPATDRSDGWNNIQKEIGGAEAGDAVTIDMNGATEVPREVLEEVAGKSVTVEVDLGGGVSWTINGQDVPEDVRLADLDLGVRMDTSGISADVLNSVSGEYGAVQVSLDHDGEFGFALTFTAPLGRENAGHWANLYHYDEDRDRLVFETSARITSNGTVSLRFSHASQYAIIIDNESHTPVELPFTDVPEDAWYGEAVRYVYEHGLMAGTGTTTFSPDMTTSRAMVATILWQQAGSPVVNYAMDYADVDPAAWYGEAVRWAASEGIAGGYGGGLFGPDDPVTREQLAAMLYQFARNQGYDLSVGQDTNILSYTDAFQVSEYAVSALQWACGAGILSGTGDGSTLSPQGEATRAQTAVMLQRFCELYQ